MWSLPDATGLLPRASTASMARPGSDRPGCRGRRHLGPDRAAGPRLANASASRIFRSSGLAGARRAHLSVIRRPALLGRPLGALQGLVAPEVPARMGGATFSRRLRTPRQPGRTRTTRPKATETDETHDDADTVATTIRDGPSPTRPTILQPTHFSPPQAEVRRESSRRPPGVISSHLGVIQARVWRARMTPGFAPGASAGRWCTPLVIFCESEIRLGGLGPGESVTATVDNGAAGHHSRLGGACDTEKCVYSRSWVGRAGSGAGRGGRCGER
jgi:hypothetical protein